MREEPLPGERDMDLKVAEALRQLAAETRPPRSLPTAGQIWWRAEVVRRLIEKPDREARRILRPAVWGETVGIALGLAVLLGFFSLQAPALLETLGRRITLGDLLPLVLFGLVPLATASLLGLLLARRT